MINYLTETPGLNHFISSSCIKGKLAKIEPSPGPSNPCSSSPCMVAVRVLSPTVVYYEYCHDRFTFYTVAVFIAWIKMPWYS